MPTYEYRCKSCGKTHEIEHGFNDKRPTECPACGGELVRVFHPIGLVFKGSGFHKTDYGGTTKRPDAKPSEAKAGETKAEPAASTDSSSAQSSDASSSPKPSETKKPDTKASGSSPKSS